MANELDELVGPINPAGNSNSKLIDFFGPNGIKSASGAFGTVGSAALKNANIDIIVVENSVEPVTTREASINSPLVKMINVLASIDGFLKQRLENQKILGASERLENRESQVEQQAIAPEIEVLQPDAEKVSGSNVGLFALGGLALLALDPVQEALKSVFNGVAETGKYLTSAISSINGVFRFLTGGSVSSEAEPPASKQQSKSGASTQPAEQGNAVAQTPEAPVPQAASEEKPSLFGSIATGAVGGALVGSIVPRVGAMGGAVVGGAYGAFKYATGDNQSSSTEKTESTSASAAPATSTSTAKEASAPMAKPVANVAATPITSTQEKSAPSAAPAPVKNVGVGAGLAVNAFSDAVKQMDPKSTSTSGSKSNAVKEASNVPNVIQVNHPETGAGWGIAGAKDAHGRPVAFSKEGAEAFSKMMQDSGGLVKPSDVTSSKRSVQKNASVDGAKNSPHLRGVAMDIHGTSNKWIRQHGYKYGWKPHDYAGTHGGHFVHGGAGMPPDEGSAGGLASAVSETVKGGMKMLGQLLGTLGSAIIKPGIPRTDPASSISKAAKEMNAEIAISKTPKEPKIPTPKTPPKINKSSSGATQNPATAADRTVVYYYLRRFGYQDLSPPEAALKVG